MKIRELYSDKSKWTQGMSARNASNQSTSILSPLATCWCLYGAIGLCYPDLNQRLDIMETLQKEFSKDYLTGVIGWNDSPDRTFEEVKALVDRLDI